MYWRFWNRVTSSLKTNINIVSSADLALNEECVHFVYTCVVLETHTVSLSLSIVQILLKIMPHYALAVLIFISWSSVPLHGVV